MIDKTPKSLKIWVSLASRPQCWELMANYARIELWPNEPYELPVRGGATDEGYSYTESSYCWYPDDGVVVAEHDTYACDCDGRIDHHNVLRCRVEDLGRELIEAEQSWVVGEHSMVLKQRQWEIDSRPVYLPGGEGFVRGKFPECSQRDYNAEAAGY